MAKARNNTSNPENASQQESSDTIELVIAINRVAKVVKGGRRFSFSALVVAGDGKGRVGFGLGKASEVGPARDKAVQAARRAMKLVPLREGRTFHHDVIGQFGSGKVIVRSAPSGTGIIAGGPMRAIFEALGVQDVVAKSIGSSNPHNMVRATFDALFKIRSPRYTAGKLGKKVGEVTRRREAAAGSKAVKQDESGEE